MTSAGGARPLEDPFKGWGGAIFEPGGDGAIGVLGASYEGLSEWFASRWIDDAVRCLEYVKRHYYG
jgi:hypothetical protein